MISSPSELSAQVIKTEVVQEVFEGEVDFLVVEKTTGKALLRIRALVMDNLGSECYGGQTFHLDNVVHADVTTGCMSLHRGRYIVNRVESKIMKPSPPPVQSIRELPMTKAAASTVLMKPEKFWIPSGEYKIPLEGSSD